MTRRAIAMAAVGALCACSRAPSDADAKANAMAMALLNADAGAIGIANVDAAVASRCTLSESGVTLGDVGDRRALVLGDAVATNDGFAVGLVHAPSVGAEAMIARVVGHKVAEEWIVAKRGELIADAPPPIPLLGPSVLYAVYLARDSDAGASRRIALKKSGVAAPVASFSWASADSLSFDAAMSLDVARVAMAWDDDAIDGAPARGAGRGAPAAGGIRVAIVPLATASPIAPRVLSDSVTDVDAPRLAPRLAGGFWVAWTARREETPDAGARVEAPSEARAFTWIELVAIDASGAPVGPVRKVTSPTGHVASFDLALRPHGELDLFARDETQSREGEGGKIVHVVAREASIDDAVVIATGAGRGAVDLVTGANGAAWLSYIDAQDHPRVVPLGESRAPVGPATIEDALDGARLLTIPSDPSVISARFVAAVPTSDAAIFRDVTCAR